MLTESNCGVVNCDRAQMSWNVGCPQWCWAHLKRDFPALVDRPDPQVKRLGHDLMRLTQEMFRSWAHCREATLDRTNFLNRMRPIRLPIGGLLPRGVFRGDARLK